MPYYADLAGELGKRFAEVNYTLIYGGGNIGLMGIIADTVIANKGHVIGVIPDFLLKREVAHHLITRLEVVSTMHERKKRMVDLSDAFVAMPGGWGTLDELAEILTWKQLGLVDKRVFILNSNGFFDHLISQMQQMTESGFLSKSNFDSLGIAQSVDELMALLIS
jgi:uncharacterized protein (TIGR00730 family)